MNPNSILCYKNFLRSISTYHTLWSHFLADIYYGITHSFFYRACISQHFRLKNQWMQRFLMEMITTYVKPGEVRRTKTFSVNNQLLVSRYILNLFNLLNRRTLGRSEVSIRFLQVTKLVQQHLKLNFAGKLT